MSDTVMKDQPEVVAPAAEAQAVEETTPAVAAEESTRAVAATESTAVAATEESDKKVDEAIEAQNGEDKKSEDVQNAGARPNPRDFKKNRKYDPSTQPVTDDPVKVRGQVEFYFSDSNLPTDKFMWESTGGEENKPMSLKTICGFKRMRQFQPYIAVVAALRESSFLEVEGEEDQETVRRKKAYVSSSDAQKARLAASVYAKGFGEEEPSTQFDIEAFFSNYGHVKHVKLRRTGEDLFKGSVFVEFETPEETEKFAQLDPKPTWKGEELLVMMKKAYLDEKNRQIKEGLIEPNTNRRSVFFEGKERGGARGGRGGRGRGGHEGKSGEWKDRDQKNGFKGGRGGRGRGRGGRGFRGGRGGGRDRDNKGRDEKKTDGARANTNDVQMPTIQSTATKNGETNGKRAREDDGGDAPAAKKVDTKTEATAAQ